MKNRRHVSASWSLLALALAVLVAGAGCPSFDFPFPRDEPVVIELINAADHPVDPRLYVSPYEDDDIDGILDPANFIDIGEPIAVGEPPVEITFQSCAEAGAMVTDFAQLLISETQFIESDNAPIIRRGIDFDCGDTVTFIFIDAGEGEFYTRVEVNGVFLTDR